MVIGYTVGMRRVFYYTQTSPSLYLLQSLPCIFIYFITSGIKPLLQFLLVYLMFI